MDTPPMTLATGLEVGAALLLVFAAWRLRPREPAHPWRLHFQTWMAAFGGDASAEVPLEVARTARGTPGPLDDFDAVARNAARRLDEFVVLTLGAGAAPAVAAAVPGLRARALDVTLPPAELADLALGSLTARSDRALLVAQGSACLLALQALHAHEVLRDAVRAVVLLEPTWDDDGAAWVNAHLRHEEFDVELFGRTPYLVVRRKGAPGPAILQPAVPRSGVESLQIIDLGDVEDPAAPPVVRALWVTVMLRLLG